MSVDADKADKPIKHVLLFELTYERAHYWLPEARLKYPDANGRPYGIVDISMSSLTSRVLGYRPDVVLIPRRIGPLPLRQFRMVNDSLRHFEAIGVEIVEWDPDKLDRQRAKKRMIGAMEWRNI